MMNKISAEFYNRRYNRRDNSEDPPAIKENYYVLLVSSLQYELMQKLNRKIETFFKVRLR